MHRGVCACVYGTVLCAQGCVCVRADVRDSLVCTGVCVRACTGQFSVHRGVCACVYGTV